MTFSSVISSFDGDQHLAGVRVDDVLERDAAEDAVAEPLDDLAALDQRPISMPSMVPQSYSAMMLSCATSTRRRVRYPEFAVLSAVSARPLRAPWVEMKYCSTDSPSRKFVVIGVSMISPDGLAIRPRMPASCRICCAEPRAPESAMM